ncbi:MAG: family 78 glycoside hydrolase catalytic domain [bacterium]
MEWKARWIWDESGEHPRNYWLSFRREFEVSQDVDDAILYITADSRYTLFVNGTRIGFGPIRSWPFEQSYDTYSIRDYLAPGKNVIAVLVTHFGISTFQYIEGRGGLIAQLELYKDGKLIDSIISDRSWKSSTHTGFVRDSVRISCQQPWAEIYDAIKFDDRWIDVDFDDDSWNNSIELGSYGMEPWRSLMPRDIPYLTEETIYPKRIVSFKETIPVKNHISIDLRPVFHQGEYDANPKRHLGYIATIITSPKDTEGRVIFPFGRWVSVYGNFKIDDRVYEVGNRREVEVELKAGDNFFLMETSGTYHELFLHMAFDFEEKLIFKAPIFGEEYNFVSIGPFDKKDLLLVGTSQEDIIKEPEEYREIWKVDNLDSLSRFIKWINPIPSEYTCSENVFTLSTVKTTVNSYDVPRDYQNMVIANNSYANIVPFKDGDVEFIVDFGRELSGFVEFDIDTPSGVILDLYFFESMHDGIIEHTDGLNNTLRYKTRKGRQSYRSFIRRGFRYVMISIRNLSSSMKFYSIKTWLSTFPVAEVGTFYSSDYLLNRIWEISRDTERLCMEDTYVDCPAYEQTFWVGDARNESLINYYTFGAYELSKRCLRLVPKSLYRSILPESQVPSGWQNILTAWTLFWMSACKEYYEFSGDREFLEEIYPYLMETSRNFERFINRDGLLEITAWNMLDWAPMDTPNSGVVTHQNALLVKALSDTAYISDLLGKEEDKGHLLGVAKSLKEAINRYLWNDERKAFVDSIHSDGKYSDVISLQTNTIVYLCDCVEGKRKEFLEKYLLDPPEDFVKIGSPFMSFFYYEALVKLGKMDKILEDIRKNWGTMLEYGATTCWETFIGFLTDRLTRSHCHAWSSAPGYFLSAYVLGIRPLEPGFKKVLIEPNLCGLKWARGIVPTPAGNIEVSYKEEDEYLDVVVTLPKDVTGEIVFPSTLKNRVRFNGKYMEGLRETI